MKVLSIDFDFFVKGADEYVPPDTLESKSHAWENLERDLKKKGKTLKQKFPFTGPSFREFLSHFDLRKTPQLDIWDTHLDILAFIQDKTDLEIYNVDAHHDLYYCEPLSQIRTVVDCGNWGGYLVSRRRVKSWTQIYPDWKPEVNFARHKLAATAHYGTRAGVKKLSEINLAPDVLFVCRSSQWVPPIYDKKFSEFCQAIAKAGRFNLPQAPRFPRTEDTRLLKYLQVEPMK